MTDRIDSNQPKAGRAGQSRAVGLFLLKRYEEAFREFDILLAADPENMTLRTNKALARLYAQRPDAGFFDEMLANVNEMPAQGYLCAAEALLAFGRAGDAMVFVEKALEKDDANIDAYLLKVRLLEDLGREEELPELLNAVYPRFENDERILCLCAAYAVQFENMRQSQYFLNKALKINRPAVLQNDCFYRCSLAGEKEEKLIPLALEALDNRPGNRDIMVFLAEAYVLAEEYEKADEIYMRLAGMSSELPDELKVRWADLLYRMDDYVRAFEMAKSVSERYPGRTGLFSFLRRMLYLLIENEMPDIAAECAREWYNKNPGDKAVAHVCAALAAMPDNGPPPEYAEILFDGFADDFDVNLSGSLDYKGAALLEEVFGYAGLKKGMSLDILDAGCGTGFLGPVLAGYAEPDGMLTGVDVSGEMLEKALEKELYTRLEKNDLVSFFKETEDSFDIIVCMDVLSYFSDLSEVMSGFFEMLEENGIAVFTILKARPGETSSFALRKSGQYVHAREYVLQCLAEAGLEEIYCTEEILRQEHELPVSCWFFAVRKMS